MKKIWKIIYILHIKFFIKSILYIRLEHIYRFTNIINL